jgi:DNA polymerase-3 subunit delta
MRVLDHLRPQGTLKVYPDKIEAALQRSIATIYIVSGDEPLLVQETCDLIRLGLKNAGYLERELFHVEAGFDWQQVLFSANSMSLFAEQKLLEIRMRNASPGDKGIDVLKSFVEDPPEGTVMMLVLPRLDQKSQRTKWFKTIEQAGTFVQVWPIDLKDMPNWVNNRFRKAGLNATRDAVTVMVQRLEGNLLAAVQEIERLKLSSVDGKVDVQQVQEGVADNSRYDVFALLDAAVGGDPVRTLKVARGLQLEGTEMLYILAMLSRELRDLAMMADEVKSGSLDSALKKGRVWPKRKNLVSRCLRDHGGKDFLELLSRTADIDAMVKGIHKGDPWDELISITLQLAGTRSVPGQVHRSG